MYPVSNTVKALFEAEQRQVLRITGTDKNGTSISITEANVMENGFNIDRASVNGDKLEVGTAIASELTLKLDNREGQFDGVVFEGTELFVEIGIADWTQTTPTVSWIPCGYFTPDEQPRSLSTITIHALDRMMNFDKIPPTLTPWTDNYGNIIKDNFGEPIYFLAEIAFPTTVKGLIEQTCARCSVPFTQTITSLPNYNYQITSLPNIQQEITFRNLIQWCAGILACNAWIDWTGELKFSWYGESTGYETTVSNRYSSDVHEDDIEITGVQYTNTQGVTIVSGDADYTIDMTGNYLAMTGVATIMPAVKNIVAGFTYRPFEASVINAPYLWPMDMITFTKGEDDFTCAVTNVNFGINGTTSLAGKGESQQAQSRIDPNGVTNEQGFLIEKAVDAAVESVVNHLDQEAIFNLLTNNGEDQGLIMYQGKVYLNAQYIQAGTISADFFKGVTLTLGGSNNANGSLLVKDANGNTIGTWTKDGINVSKGTIQGPNIVAGGSNNANGTITVKDANGNTIGTWTKDGLNMSSGTISGGTINGASVTLGGDNDTSGMLSVKNSSGTTIGMWNSSGLIMKSGYIDINNSGSNGKYVDVKIAQTYSLPLSIEYQYALNASGLFRYDEGGLCLDQNTAYFKGITTLTGEYICVEAANSLTSSPRIDVIDDYTSSVRKHTRLQPGKLEVAYIQNSSQINALYVVADPNNKAVNVSANFTVASGYSKNKIATTDQYADRLLYCYETASPMYGDVGEGVIADDGLSYVSLDPIFAQTITTDNYQVFLQKYGDGDCWIKERHGGYFIVQGTPNLAFGWEIKSKQADLGAKRLERFEQTPWTVPQQTYADDAARYIEELQNGRISA